MSTQDYCGFGDWPACPLWEDTGQLAFTGMETAVHVVAVVLAVAAIVLGAAMMKTRGTR